MSSRDDNDDQNSSVQLGFSVSYEDEEHRCLVAHRTPLWKEWDGGQIGGRPSWLQPRDLPRSFLECKTCQRPLVFICQLYAPADEVNPNAFHRSLYVFACTNNQQSCTDPASSIRVLRTQLPEENPFYPMEEEEENWSQHKPESWNVNLCKVCGQRGNGRCPIQQECFCGKHHQKEYKRYVRDKELHTSFLPSVYAESELVVEEDPASSNDNADAAAHPHQGLFSDDTNDEEDADLEQEDLNTITGAVTSKASNDQATSEFYARTRLPNVQDQCLRYLRWPSSNLAASDNIMPLWIRSDHQPDKIPCCEYCGADRDFEFQIMPQMIHYLMQDHSKRAQTQEETEGAKQAIAQAASIIDQASAEQVPPDFAEAQEKAVAAMRSRMMEEEEEGLNWGVVAVYTCTASCGDGLDIEDDIEMGAYREEYAWKQPSLD
eukprot:scaffold11809_cov128-Cylindrotheca_fusiformis.AAC.4